ncbi:MAG TPA: uracil-DNA glycosylase [Thermoplasmata archaeon]
MDDAGPDAAVTLRATANRILACTRCRLHRGRTNAVPGEGSPGAAVLFLGEAPGRDEDAAGRPFVGSAGKILRKAIEAARLPPGQVFITNTVKCRPPCNRAPRTDELAACRPYLAVQIAAVRPKVIVTLGSTALRGLTGSRQKVSEARKADLSFQGISVRATYHPAAILYNRKLEPELRNDLRKVARRIRSHRRGDV